MAGQYTGAQLVGAGSRQTRLVIPQTYKRSCTLGSKPNKRGSNINDSGTVCRQGPSRFRVSIKAPLIFLFVVLLPASVASAQDPIPYTVGDQVVLQDRKSGDWITPLPAFEGYGIELPWFAPAPGVDRSKVFTVIQQSGGSIERLRDTLGREWELDDIPAVNVFPWVEPGPPSAHYASSVMAQVTDIVAGNFDEWAVEPNYGQGFGVWNHTQGIAVTSDGIWVQTQSADTEECQDGISTGPGQGVLQSIDPVTERDRVRLSFTEHDACDPHPSGIQAVGNIVAVHSGNEREAPAVLRFFKVGSEGSFEPMNHLKVSLDEIDPDCCGTDNPSTSGVGLVYVKNVGYFVYWHVRGGGKLLFREELDDEGSGNDAAWSNLSHTGTIPFGQSGLNLIMEEGSGNMYLFSLGVDDASGGFEVAVMSPNGQDPETYWSDVSQGRKNPSIKAVEPNDRFDLPRTGPPIPDDFNLGHSFRYGGDVHVNEHGHLEFLRAPRDFLPEIAGDVDQLDYVAIRSVTGATVNPVTRGRIISFRVIEETDELGADEPYFISNTWKGGVYEVDAGDYVNLQTSGLLAGFGARDIRSSSQQGTYVFMMEDDSDPFIDNRPERIGRIFFPPAHYALPGRQRYKRILSGDGSRYQVTYEVQGPPAAPIVISEDTEVGAFQTDREVIIDPGVTYRITGDATLEETGRITNLGILIIDGSLTAFGSIDNRESGSIQIGGVLTLAEQLSNSGVISSRGILRATGPNGFILNEAGGIIDDQAGEFAYARVHNIGEIYARVYSSGGGLFVEPGTNPIAFSTIYLGPFTASGCSRLNGIWNGSTLRCLTRGYWLTAGESLVIDQGVTLDIRGATFVNDGTISNAGVLENANGRLVNCGTIAPNASTVPPEACNESPQKDYCESFGGEGAFDQTTTPPTCRLPMGLVLEEELVIRPDMDWVVGFLGMGCYEYVVEADQLEPCEGGSGNPHLIIEPGGKLRVNLVEFYFGPGRITNFGDISFEGDPDPEALRQKLVFKGEGRVTNHGTIGPVYGISDQSEPQFFNHCGGSIEVLDDDDYNFDDLSQFEPFTFYWDFKQEAPCPGDDTDNDGVEDLQDLFPEDPLESADRDGDGVGDNADLFPDDSLEFADLDGDGIGDNSDEFPMAVTRGGSGAITVTTTPISSESSCSLVDVLEEPLVAVAEFPTNRLIDVQADFSLSGCRVDSEESIVVSIDFGQVLPESVGVFKVPGTGNWERISNALVKGSVVTYVVTDNGELDDNPVPGEIDDSVTVLGIFADVFKSGFEDSEAN